MFRFRPAFFRSLPNPILAALLVAGLAAVGCSSDDEKGKAPGEPEIKGLPASAPPFVGVSTRSVAKEEARRIGGGFGAAGPWRLTLGTGAYNLQSRRRLMVGTIRVSGNRMVFAQTGKRAKRSKTNPCGATKGVYRWSTRGKTLTFKKILDGCAARAALTGGPWMNRTKR